MDEHPDAPPIGTRRGEAADLGRREVDELARIADECRGVPEARAETYAVIEAIVVRPEPGGIR